MNNENFNVKFGEVINTGGTSDFNNLDNRPKYDNEEMTGETNIPKVPTTTSELTNNSGFITGAELGTETTAREQADNALQTEIDGLNNSKADKSTTYTKTEVDTALDAKADKSTTYTKTEVDTALDSKADKSTTYTKIETDGLICEIAGKIKVLTTEDYNWPVDNPTGIAPWLLDEGWYTGEDGVRLFQSPSGSTYITLYEGKTFYIGLGTGPGGEKYYRTKYIYRIGEHGLANDGGVYRSAYAWITWFAKDNSGVQHIYFSSLADLSERVIQKAGAPTTSTEGVLGQLWEDSSNGELYQLKSIDTSVTPNTYTWEQVGGGGSYTAGDGIDITNDEISVTNTGKARALTTADYNYPADNPTRVALWLLEPGLYYAGTGVSVRVNSTINAAQGVYFVTQESSGVKSILDLYSTVPTGIVYNVQVSNGADMGSSPITTPIVQSTGTSNNTVMSQIAVTGMVFADPTAKEKVQIGSGSIGSGSDAVAVGHTAIANGNNCIVIGMGRANATGAISIGNHQVSSGGASAVGSIALGYGASASDVGVMSINTNNTAYGYNESNYRLLTGLYDGQSAHDAATVGQITPTTDSSAPTSATAGRLGEIRIDTTTNTAYMCVVSDSATPAYEWKQITA